MSQTNLLKLLEAGALLLALLAFVWWQMRDLKRAREATAKQRALEAASVATEPPTDPSSAQSSRPSSQSSSHPPGGLPLTPPAP